MECNELPLPVRDTYVHPAHIHDFLWQAIRATDITLSLRGIPVGFLVTVKGDGAESQTSNKPVHVDQAVQCLISLTYVCES